MKNESMIAKNGAAWAMVLGICSLVSNILFLSIAGAPLSVGFGIMGIGAALTTLEDKKLPKQSSVAVVLCIIGIAFGILFYSILYAGVRTLQDPGSAHQILDYIRQHMDQMPPQVREYFRGLL